MHAFKIGHTRGTFESCTHMNDYKWPAFVTDRRPGCRKKVLTQHLRCVQVEAAETLKTSGVLPLRSPHVGALHVVLVGTRPDHLGSDLIQIEERLRTGSILCGNFGGASLVEIQTRKKLAALTAITSAPEGADAGASTAHIFAGTQLEVRSVIRLNEDFSLLSSSWSLV